MSEACDYCFPPEDGKGGKLRRKRNAGGKAGKGGGKTCPDDLPTSCQSTTTITTTLGENFGKFHIFRTRIINTTVLIFLIKTVE